MFRKEDIQTFVFILYIKCAFFLLLFDAQKRLGKQFNMHNYACDVDKSIEKSGKLLEPLVCVFYIFSLSILSFLILVFIFIQLY